MTTPRNIMQGPVHLGLPLVEPDPAPGCLRCRQLAEQREAARAAGDKTRVSDCNVRLRRHPHEPPSLSLPDTPAAG